MLNDYIIMMYAVLSFFFFFFALFWFPMPWILAKSLSQSHPSEAGLNSLNKTCKGQFIKTLRIIQTREKYQGASPICLSGYLCSTGRKKKSQEQDLNAVFWQVIKIPITNCLLPRSSQVQKHISKATVHAYKTKKVVEKDEEWKNQDNMNNLVDLWGV